MCRTRTSPRGAPLTAAELAKHNTKESCWVAVNGKVHDVTSFLPKHPGGEDFLLLAAGRDITHLFQSYHPLTTAPAALLQKYYLGDLVDAAEEVTYVSPPERKEFYPTLCARIKEHFKTNNINPKYSNALGLRLLLTHPMMLLFYFLTHFYFTSLFTSVVSALLFGLVQALFSLQIMHDASHCAVTRYPLVWRAIGASWDIFTGAHFYMWMNSHTIGHHVHTNVHGHDPDVGGTDREKPELRRVAPVQKFFKYYEWQHLYCFVLYPFLTFKFRIEDSLTHVTQMVGFVRVNPSKLWLSVWSAGKISFIIFRFILPLALSSAPWTRFLLLHVITELVTGFWLTFNFQVSHMTDDLMHYDAQADGNKNQINEDWAVSQVVTAVDYAHDNKIWTFLCGALNYQIEHHLFPTINQTLYPEIAPIVQQTCADFGIPYRYIPTYTEAIMAHVNYIKNMAKPGWQPTPPKFEKPKTTAVASKKE